MMTKRMKNAYEMLMGIMDANHLVSKEVVKNRISNKLLRPLILDGYITPIGEMYEVFVYPTAEELKCDTCKNLGCAVALQAAKDFFDKPWESEGILNMLRSDHMDLVTDGLSIKLANTLKTNPEQVKEVITWGVDEE